jgi:hypothetical protein
MPTGPMGSLATGPAASLATGPAASLATGPSTSLATWPTAFLATGPTASVAASPVDCPEHKLRGIDDDPPRLFDSHVEAIHVAIARAVESLPRASEDAVARVDGRLLVPTPLEEATRLRVRSVQDGRLAALRDDDKRR